MREIDKNINLRYAGLIPNDTANGEGFCVSFFVQGCCWHCKSCQNPGTWDFNSGLELPSDYLRRIDAALTANNVQRNFSLLGGEPLCPENISLSRTLVTHVRTNHPSLTIYVWTGDTYEHLSRIAHGDATDEDINPSPLSDGTAIKGWDTSAQADLYDVLSQADVLIDGPYIDAQRDITLKLRGSTNQRVVDLKKTRENEKNGEDKIVLYRF